MSLLPVVAVIVALLVVAGLYRCFNRWWIARRNGWRTGWQHVAKRRTRW